MNPRKDKILYNLWLDKAEEISLEECIEILRNDKVPSKQLGYAMSNITDIIQTAFERGDLEKA